MFGPEDIANYHKIFDQTPIAFAVIEVRQDDRGEPHSLVFRYLNDACAALAGRKREELTESSFYEVFPNADGKWLMYAAETACRGRRNIFTDNNRALGRYLRVEYYQLVEGFCGCVITDLTEEMKIRQQLQTEQESFKAALSCTGLHHWEYDVQHDMAIQSDKCVRDLQIPKVMKNYPQSFLDTNLILPQYWSRYLEVHRELKQGAKEVMMEHQIWPPNAREPSWERLIYKNIFDDSGRPVRAVGTAIDITEEKRLQSAYEEFSEYQRLMAANTFDAYKLNVTKDTIVAVKDSHVVFKDKNNRYTMSEFFRRSMEHLSDPEERKQYVEIYTREKMLRRFASGERNAALTCRYRTEKGGAQFLKLHLSMAQHPVTKDVLAFTWGEDVTEKKLDEAAMQSVIDHDYEVMFRIDGLTRKFVVFLHAKGVKTLPALSGDDFDAENVKFAKEHMASSAQCRERVSALSVENMVKQLDEKGFFRYYYDIEEGGVMRRKEMQCYYIDKESKLICAARSDVSGAAQDGK